MKVSGLIPQFAAGTALLDCLLVVTSRMGTSLRELEEEVTLFNKSIQCFFSVGYSVVAINHVVDFKEKKQVK